MLSLLRVSGFALIDELELPLGSGFTVITGETGAGKSILVDAIALLRGGRASADVIRTGRDEAQVEAVFELPPGWQVRARLESDGRDLSEGLLVRRLVARNGRGRAYLAGGLATAGELSAVIGPLCDITSQHDQQSLMDPDSQLAIVDAFADNGDLREQMRAAHEALASARAELIAFDADARTRAQREDLLRFQLQELDEAKLVPGEDESLRLERDRAKGAEKLYASAARGEATLYSGEAAVVGQVGATARDLETLATIDPTLAPLAERLREAQALIEDVASELGRYAGGLRFEPGRLEQIEERLFTINRLLRKHGGTVGEVIARREHLQRELDEMGSFEEALETRRQGVEQARARAASVAGQLSERRHKAARSLGKKIDETLKELGLAGAHVTIVVEDRPASSADEALGATGQDRVRFVFAPNPGEEPRPLARIASGGELSRVMLACKRALARGDQSLTYVFDEVDTGVGGAVAEVIGRKLKAIAAERQVLAVTHLPQIAAFADHHIKVEKQVAKGRTTVTIRPLGAPERIAELARMLGGSAPSKKATEHADEMLRRAQAAG